MAGENNIKAYTTKTLSAKLRTMGQKGRGDYSTAAGNGFNVSGGKLRVDGGWHLNRVATVFASGNLKRSGIKNANDFKIAGSSKLSAMKPGKRKDKAVRKAVSSARAAARV